MRIPDNAMRTVVIVLALVSAGFFAAYLRFLPYLDREATYTDGRQHYELDEIERLRFAVWDDAEALGVEVNGAEDEGRGAVSPDGRYLVFTVGEEGLNADLYVADLVDGRAVDARPLMRANTSADDMAPAFSADALWLSSNRPGGMGGFDLYRVPYTDGTFGFAEELEPGLNTSADEYDPAPVPGSRAVAFASSRRRAMGLDLYLAAPQGEMLTTDGTLVDPVLVPDADNATPSAWTITPLDALNTAFHDRDPAFTNDGLTLYFASNRVGGAGGFDLYQSVQSAGAWQPSQALGSLNEIHDERAPSPSRDGFTLLFTTSDGLSESSDLLRATSRELYRLPGRPVGWLDLTVLALLLLLALLAWLGKHWEALDILYKCLLISLLIHLLLAYWFRDVYVENEQVELPPPEPSFRVTLAASPSMIAQRQERAGQVDNATSRSDVAAEAPSRAEAAALADLVGEQDAPTPEASGGLDAPQLAQAEAPSAAPAGEASPTRDAGSATSSVELSAPSDSTATRSSNDVAAMVVTSTRVSNDSDAAAARGTPSVRVRPSRSESGDPGLATAMSAPAPARGELSVPALSANDSPATSGSVASGARAADAPRPERARGAATPSLVALEGGGPTRSAPEAAPELSLDGLGASSGGERSAPATSRGSPSAPSRLASSLGSAGDLPRNDVAPPGGSLAALDVASGSPSSGPSVSSSTSASAPSRTNALGDIALSSLDDGADEGLRRTTAPTSESSSSLDVASLNLGSATLPSSRRRNTPNRRPTRAGSPSASTSILAAPISAPALAPLSMPIASADSRPAPVTTPVDTFAQTPYRTRFGDEKLRALEEFGGSDETERAVRLGLQYLADIQRADGHWGSANDYDDKYGRVTVGKTGLCLLAFLGAGHTPDSDTQHSDVTRRAVELLLTVQDDDSGHFGYTAAYSHGIATYALAECYALTKDAKLLRPIERAVAHILRNQKRSSDRRFNGGWSYYYPDERTHDRWPRSSITAWQVMALESARLGGIEVPDAAFDAAGGFLRAAHRSREGVVLYSHDPARLNSSYWTLPGSTPAGLFALSLLGEDLSDSKWSSALRFVRNRAPSGYRMRSQDAFVEDASGNLYFWYYGTLTMFRRGGADWDEWNEQLQETLLPSQSDNGSWRPISVYSEYAGDTNNDRSYTTAINVLTLEVYYRYFTPLLEVK